MIKITATPHWQNFLISTSLIFSFLFFCLFILIAFQNTVDPVTFGTLESYKTFAYRQLLYSSLFVGAHIILFAIATKWIRLAKFIPLIDVLLLVVCILLFPTFLNTHSDNPGLDLFAFYAAVFAIAVIFSGLLLLHIPISLVLIKRKNAKRAWTFITAYMFFTLLVPLYLLLVDYPKKRVELYRPIHKYAREHNMQFYNSRYTPKGIDYVDYYFYKDEYKISYVYYATKSKVPESKLIITENFIGKSSIDKDFPTDKVITINKKKVFLTFFHAYQYRQNVPNYVYDGVIGRLAINNTSIKIESYSPKNIQEAESELKQVIQSLESF